MVTEDKTRSDIIMDISKDVGVEEGTVNQILSGAIDCPPEERLRGFAQVLDVSMGSIMAAWDADGCAMPAEEEAKNKAADDDEPDHKMENIALKAEIAELKAKAKAADDDEEEMKAKAEEDKAKAEHEEEEEKKEEEAKALLIFDAMTSDKITKFEAKNLLTEPLDFVNKTLKSRIVNHTGGAQTESPSNEPKEDCNAIWKAMLSDGKRTEAQAYYKENSEKITKKEK